MHQILFLDQIVTITLEWLAYLHVSGKWNGKRAAKFVCCFFSLSPPKALYNPSHHSHTYSHTNGRWLLCPMPTCSSGTHMHTFTHRWRSRREQISSQYLAQRHLLLLAGGVRYGVTDVLMSADPLYLLSCSHSLCLRNNLWDKCAEFMSEKEHWWNKL